MNFKEFLRLANLALSMLFLFAVIGLFVAYLLSFQKFLAPYQAEWGAVTWAWTGFGFFFLLALTLLTNAAIPLVKD